MGVTMRITPMTKHIDALNPKVFFTDDIIVWQTNESSTKVEKTSANVATEKPAHQK